MTENNNQSKMAQKERVQDMPSFQQKVIKQEEKKLATANESKPLFQTYIYRSYGGGYQGL